MPSKILGKRDDQEKTVIVAVPELRVMMGVPEHQ